MPEPTKDNPEDLYQATVYAWGVQPRGASKLKNIKLVLNCLVAT